MAKYKVGDKVRIKKVEECEPSFAWNHDGKMDHWCGQIMTIRSLLNESGYEMKEDINENDGGWAWHEDWLEPITYFTKDDLKTGMTVKTRCGDRLAVHGKCLLGEDESYYLYTFSSDLKCNFDKDLDILAINDINEEVTCLGDILCYPGKLIWSRPKEREISSEEAFKILKEHYGCDVKIKE